MNVPDVPIVGHPFIVRAWYVTAIVNCVCDSKRALALTGFNIPTTCPECGNTLMITRMLTANGKHVLEIAKMAGTISAEATEKRDTRE